MTYTDIDRGCYNDSIVYDYWLTYGSADACYATDDINMTFYNASNAAAGYPVVEASIPHY